MITIILNNSGIIKTEDSIEIRGRVVICTSSETKKDLIIPLTSIRYIEDDKK